MVLVGDVEVDCGCDLLGWNFVGDEKILFDERSDFECEWPGGVKVCCFEKFEPESDCVGFEIV